MIQQSEFKDLLYQLKWSLVPMDQTKKECCGLTAQQCSVIETLGRVGACTMNELSRHNGVAVCTMTRIINILVRDKIVIREPSKSDRRRVYISLITKGKRICGSLEDCCKNYTDIVLSQVPEEKRAKVIDSVKHLINAIEKAKTECCL